MTLAWILTEFLMRFLVFYSRDLSDAASKRRESFGAATSTRCLVSSSASTSLPSRIRNDLTLNTASGFFFPVFSSNSFLSILKLDSDQ